MILNLGDQGDHLSVESEEKTSEDRALGHISGTKWTKKNHQRRLSSIIQQGKLGDLFPRSKVKKGFPRGGKVQLWQVLLLIHGR